MVVRPPHPSNAPNPILVTESGIVTLVRPVQSANAWSPRYATELGMVTLVRLVHPENASFPMLVTGSPSIRLGITRVVAAPVYFVMVILCPLFLYSSPAGIVYASRPLTVKAKSAAPRYSALIKNAFIMLEFSFLRFIFPV